MKRITTREAPPKIPVAEPVDSKPVRHEGRTPAPHPRETPPTSKIQHALRESTAADHGAPGVGATVQKYRAAASFRPLAAMLEALDESHDVPEDFEAVCAELDAYKAARIMALGDKPSVDAVHALVDTGDRIHGKVGHRNNAVAVAETFLADQAFVEAIGGAGARVVDAVRWLNLGDLDAPVGVLTVRRRLTDAETEAWIDTRPERAEALFARFRLGDDATRALIGTHKANDRSTDAALVDLFDQLAALGAKPFFQAEGAPNVDKIFGAVRSNAEGKGVAPELLDALQDAAERGLLAAAIASVRDHDQYVR